MYRTCCSFLDEWLTSSDRKPLVIRGARQVGKTWLVKDLALRHRLHLIEINFEHTPSLARLFDSSDPQRILLNLSSLRDEHIDPNSSLLFLDEIQAAPEILAKLRWFAEDMPSIPVIAAGSLLEFVLEKHTFSMPVGRISYMHLEPLSFEEFLQANQKKGLINFLLTYEWNNEIPHPIHQQFLEFFKEYLIVGGMPAVVASWLEKRSLKHINQIHHDLLATYRDDAAKYSGRMSMERLDEVLMSVPESLGEKFIYSRVNSNVQISSIKHALDLLCKARVCHKVRGCAANGIPLKAEIQDKFLKVIFLDVGLCSAALGLSLDMLTGVQELNLINKGGIAEQATGQILRTINPYFLEPALYYWQRETKGSSSEIDYIIQHRNSVIPIEVKAGSTGSLKSLHFFMKQKEFTRAVRVNSDFPSKCDVNFKDHEGNPVNYTLLSMPIYLLGQLHRLLSGSEASD